MTVKIYKYKVFNQKGEFLGVINGLDEEDALHEALIFEMRDAYRAEKIILSLNHIYFQKKALIN